MKLKLYRFRWNNFKKKKNYGDKNILKNFFFLSFEAPCKQNISNNLSTFKNDEFLALNESLVGTITLFWLMCHVTTSL